MRRRQIQLDFSLLNIQSCNTNVVSIKATEEKQRANYRQRDNKESLEMYVSLFKYFLYVWKPWWSIFA